MWLVFVAPVVCPLSGMERPDSASGWEPGTELAQVVREALARQWGVVPESLVLEWGTPRGGDIPPDYQTVDLIGHGRDGRWVVAFRPEVGSPDARSVLLRAGVIRSVPVARRALERGARLEESDLEFQSRTRWGPGEATDSCQVGWIAQRRIDAGEVLAKPAVRPPLMVVSGRPVRVVWSNGKVSLTVQATAVSSGSRGERVFVRTSEGTRLDGVVQGPGLVLISSSWMEQGK